MEDDALLWDLLKKEEFLTEKTMEQFGERGKKAHLGLECVGEGGRGMMGREKEQRGPREDGVLLIAQSSADGQRAGTALWYSVLGAGTWGAFPWGFLGQDGSASGSLPVPPSPPGCSLLQSLPPCLVISDPMAAAAPLLCLACIV